MYKPSNIGTQLTLQLVSIIRSSKSNGRDLKLCALTVRPRLHALACGSGVISCQPCSLMYTTISGPRGAAVRRTLDLCAAHHEELQRDAGWETEHPYRNSDTIDPMPAWGRLRGRQLDTGESLQSFESTLSSQNHSPHSSPYESTSNSATFLPSIYNRPNSMRNKWNIKQQACSTMECIEEHGPWASHKGRHVPQVALWRKRDSIEDPTHYKFRYGLKRIT